MLNIETTFTQDSQACPGVRFTMSVLNQYQRALRDSKLVDARVRMSELAAKLLALPDPDADAGAIRARCKTEDRQATPEEQATLDKNAIDPDVALRRIERHALDHRVGLLINTELKPAYVRASLLSVEGLQVSGQDPKAPWDSLIEHAPDGLIDELYVAASLNSGLTEAQEKN